MKSASPLNASTVVLLRDGSQGLEVYLLEKSRSLEFAGGAYVFPGGSVDKEDEDEGWYSLFPHLNPEALREKIPDIPGEKALSFYIAALRELFEEAGILLSRSLPAGEQKTSMRKSLLSGEKFAGLVQSFHLTLSPEALVYYAHWITPEIYPIRFSARFFLAAAPPDQEPSPDGREVLRGIWISPARAIHESSSHALPLMTPTAVTLQELSHFQKVSEALEWGEKRVKIPRKPWVDEMGEIHLS